jgi:hypothetical protein
MSAFGELSTWYLRIQVGALLHERPDREPERIGERELILDQFVLEIAGMGVVPLVGREPGHHEHRYRDQDVGREHVQPDIHR